MAYRIVCLVSVVLLCTACSDKDSDPAVTPSDVSSDSAVGPDTAEAQDTTEDLLEEVLVDAQPISDGDPGDGEAVDMTQGDLGADTPALADVADVADAEGDPDSSQGDLAADSPSLADVADAGGLPDAQPDVEQDVLLDVEQEVVEPSDVLSDGPSLETTPVEDVQTEVSDAGSADAGAGDASQLQSCPGDYLIEDAEQLAGLALCSSIEGDLRVEKTSLTSLDALSNLETVGGELKLFQNAELVDLSALSNLKAVDGKLVLNQNNALTSLAGLGSLTNIGEGLYVGYNGVLPNLDGLDGLIDVGFIFIGVNNALKHIDALVSLETVGSHLLIKNNGALEQLDGLGQLKTVGHYLQVSDNAALTDITGLSLLESVNSELTIVNNGALCQSQIEDVISDVVCGGEVTMEGNDDDC